MGQEQPENFAIQGLFVPRETRGKRRYEKLISAKIAISYFTESLRVFTPFSRVRVYFPIYYYIYFKAYSRKKFDFLPRQAFNLNAVSSLMINLEPFYYFLQTALIIQAI